MKKFLSVFLALSLLLTLCPVFSLHTAALETGDFTYEALADGTLEITGYNGNDAHVSIYSSINGAAVTAIADNAFAGNATMQSVLIPDTVKHIGSRAFSQCLSLEIVRFNDSQLTDIGDYAFADCPSIVYITIPAAVTSIGEDAICSFNAYDPDDPDKMVVDTNIPVLIAEGTYGEQYAIKNGLRTINNIAEFSEYLVTIKDDNTAEIIKYTGSEANLTVASSFNGHPVSSISTNAFMFNSNIQNVTLPNSLKEIGDTAFMSCDKLASVTLPDSLERIGANAFTSCTSLNKLEIPYNTTIGSYAIGYNYENGYVVNPDFTAYVYEHSNAYQYCKNDEITYELRYFTSGDYQYSLYYGFVFITKYTGSARNVTVPDTIDNAPVYSIGENAFAKNLRLYSVTLPETVEIINPYAFSGCYMLSDVVMPGVQVIGKYAFNNCWSLETVDLPAVTAIGDSAFYKCSSLTEVNLYNGLQNIGYMAFADCESLEELTIPYSVVGIKDFAMGWSDDDTDPNRIIRNADFTVNMFKGSVGEDYAKRYAQYYNLDYTFNHNYIGDVNGDGAVNVIDVTEIQRAMAGYTTVSGTAKTLADVNSDHSLDIYDATDLQWLLAFAY